MQVFTVAQMRAFDEAAAAALPAAVLMENAALRVVELVEAKFSPLGQCNVVVTCGKGNNGGDGLAIARHLAHLKPRHLLVLVPDAKQLGEGAAAQWKAFAEMPETEQIAVWHYPADVVAHDLANRVRGCDLWIDALLGTGATGPLRAPYAELIAGMATVPSVVAVDLVSGLDADTGAAPEGSNLRRAQYSVTFEGPRRGHLAREGLELSGEVWVGGLGSPFPAPDSGCRVVNRARASSLAVALHRPLDSNKGKAGRVLIVGGSVGMTGAPVLAATAALRVGAGLCIGALPAPAQPLFAEGCIEATSHALSCDPQGQLTKASADEVAALWDNVQVVALGPGLSRGEEALRLARYIVAHCPAPLVVDADGLYALNHDVPAVVGRSAPTLLTPHPGEMGHLMGLTPGEVNADRFGVAAACSAKYRAWVVLKGSRTVISSPDGELFVNLTGNSGMATGGAGDVLTGTLAGLLGQLKEPGAAMQLAVYVHGLAGDLAFEKLGIGLTAGDIVDHLPRALDLVQQPPAEDSTTCINGRLRRLV